MKDYKIFQFALISLFLIFGCKPEPIEPSDPSEPTDIVVLPIADFTVSSDSALVNDIIEFNNTSLHGNTYEWDFGDGNVSTEKNSTHSYLEAGKFTITLTVKNEDGEDSISKSVEISAPSILGKWIMSEVKFNGTEISGVTGWINFSTEKNYSTRFDHENHFGESTAIYSLDNEGNLWSNIPSAIIPFGASFGFTPEGNWRTDILCTAEKLEEYGSVAILHTASVGDIKASFDSENLTLTSSDGKTELTYQKEQ